MTILPRTTRAAILVESKKPLVIDEIELPGVLEAGQVLVRILVSGICGSQIGEIDGAKGRDPFLPHLLGHEGCGLVEAIGPGVRHVSVGNKVVLHWRKGKGIELATPTYKWNGTQVNAGWVTTFNEYAVVSENRLTVVPPDTDPEIAALFGCAVTTGFGVVVNNAKLTIGESVVVFGAGGIGLNMIQAAALVSAFPIIAVDLHDKKLAIAKSLGATHMINAAQMDAASAISQVVGRAGLDVFIDNTGVPSIIETGYNLVKPTGRLVLVGVPKKGSEIKLYSLPLHFGKVLTGSHGGEAVPQQDIPRYLELFHQDRLDLRSLVTDRVPLSDVNDAVDAMRRGQIAGRCLIALKNAGQ